MTVAPQPPIGAVSGYSAAATLLRWKAKHARAFDVPGRAIVASPDTIAELYEHQALTYERLAALENPPWRGRVVTVALSIGAFVLTLWGLGALR